MHKEGRKHRLELRGVGDIRDMYIENISISAESRVVIEALAELAVPSTADEVVDKVAELAADRRRRVKKPSAVEDRIEKINRRLGVEFVLRRVDRVGARFALSASLASK